MRNYMPEVAKMLGVEVEQTFKIKSWFAEGADDSVYKFTERDFCFYDDETGVWESSLRYADIINGNAFIIEIPFEPKDGEKYWTVYWKGIVDMPCAVYETWRGDSCDFANKVSGNCFRTEAEADAHKYEIYEKLTGRKWEKK